MSTDMMNYEALKILAKQKGRPIPSLIALDRNNDPFYVGTPQDWIDGRWFQEQWQRFGYTSGVHIRRMHYAIVSASPAINLPGGMPYENTEACWRYINDASKVARYLELVDPAAFVDRRNDKPVDRLDYETQHKVDVSVDKAEELGELALEFPDIPSYTLNTFTSPQRYHLEIWCEKSSMNDVLAPLLRDYNAALVYGKGELSITMALEAIARYQRTAKPVRIFYVSDFDPAGFGMPSSMSRKLEYYIRKNDLSLDVKLFPVVLTKEQVEHYKHSNPPILPTPIKESERRKEKFEKRHGNGDGENLAVELDALESLYPGELARILRREMDRYYDKTLSMRNWRAEGKIAARLEALVEEVRGRYEDELNEIEQDEEELQRIFDEQLKERVARHSRRRYEIAQAIQADLEQEDYKIAIEEVPEAVYAVERDGALFDSSRDYLTQNDVYQMRKGNSTYEENIA